MMHADFYDMPETYDDFAKIFTAPGEAGTKNRIRLHGLLRNAWDGVPESYDDFARTLFTTPREQMRSMKPTDKDIKDAWEATPRAVTPMEQVPGLDEWKPQGRSVVSVRPPKDPYTDGVKVENPMAAGFSESSRKMVGDTGRMLGAMTPDGRKKQQGLEMAGRMAGRNTQLPGLSVAMPTPEQPQASDGAQAAPKAQDMRGPQYYGTVVDPKTGQLKDQWLMPDGSVTTDFLKADVAAGQARKARLQREAMTVSGRLRAALKEQARLEGLMRKRIEELGRQDAEHPVATALREAADASHGMPSGLVNSNGFNDYRNDEQYRQLESAARRNRQTIQVLSDKRDGRMDGFWHSMGTKLTDGYTFADGMAEMNDAIAQLTAARRIGEINRKRSAGQELTAAEEAAEAVLKNRVVGDEVRADFGGYYGAWARAGSMFAGSLDLMKDIMMTPGAASIAKGIASGVGKVLTKGVAKVTTDKVAEHMAVRAITKATGILIGAHGAGAVVSNTGGLGHTLGDTATGVAGDVAVGAAGYEIVGQKGLMSALAEAERSRTGENGSEMFGEFIPGLGGLMMKGLEKVGLKRIAGYLTDIGRKDWYTQYGGILKAGGYNGLPGEALEEYEGHLYDILTGHWSEAKESLGDLKTHIDIWLGCATAGALLGCVPMAIQTGHTAMYYKYKHAASKADAVASSTLGERWSEIRGRIDGAANQELTDVVADVVIGGSLTQVESAAVLGYVRNLVRMRGYNLAQMSADEEGMGRDDDAEAVEDAYSDGYNSAPEESAAVHAAYVQARGRAEDIFGVEAAEWLEWLDESPARAVGEMRRMGQYSQQELDAVLDYVNAKATVNGMAQRADDDFDSQAAQCEAIVRRRVNRESGVIMPATMKIGDRQVYVVEGSVVMLPDGTAVDMEESSKDIVVMDSQTGKYEFAAPQQILRMGEPIEVQDEIDTALAELELQRDMQLEALGIGKESVNLQHGNRFGQNKDTTPGSEGRNSVRPMAAYPAGGVEANRDRSAVRSYEEGLANQHNDSAEYSQRDRREAESERLVEIAKANGQYFDRDEKASLGERYPKGTGESDVYINKEEGAVYKVKDPYAKSPMKGGVQPEDVIYEHLVHNKYFPEAAYGFEGISDENGEVRIVLSQDYVESVGRPTQERIEAALAEKGLYPEGKYRYGNDEVSVTDVTGDNALLGADGKVYFIDPVIDFKRPVAEILDSHEASGSTQRRSFAPNDEVELIDDQGGVTAGTITGEIDSDGLIEVQTDKPVNGQMVNRLTLDELMQLLTRHNGEIVDEAEVEAPGSADGANSAEVDDGFIPIDPELIPAGGVDAAEDLDARKPATPGTKADEAGDSGVADEADVAPSEEASEESEAGAETEEAQGVEAMPMRTVKEKGESWEEPDYLAATPERAHSYIYNESGLNRQEANGHVAHMAKAAKEAVDKHKKSAPKIGGSIVRYQKAKTEWEAKGAELQRAVDFWDAVMAEQKKVTDAEKAALEAQQAQEHDEAVARFEEEQRIKAEKRAEQEAIGANAVNPQLKAQWDAAPKTVGNANAHVLADGSTITGHYVLTEAGAASASHDPNNAFAPTEGFPIDENGQNVNDRDYSRDKDAQRSAIVRIIDFAKRIKNRVERAVIGRITARQAKDFAEQGIAVDETWVHSFESSAVGHNQKQHGDTTVEGRVGQIAITAEDYTRIPEILESYDSVRKSPNRSRSTGNEVIIYEKEFEDGYVYYLEEKRDKRKSLSFQTMYKKKKGTDSSDGLMPNASPSTPTAPSDNFSSVSDGKVTNSASDKQGEDVKSSVQERLAAAEGEVNTEPSEAQKKAGNYKMGHVEIDGLQISIENPKGSMRRGKDPNGTPWETEMKNTYGYIKGPEGVDGDKIDVFLSDNPTDGDVYVVDQYNTDGTFDEHKVMYGFTSATEAEAAYLSNYSADWAKGRKVVVTGVTREEFKKWLDASDRKKKPFAEYKSVKPIEAQNGGATEAAEPRQKSSRLEIEGAEKLSAERAEAVERYAEGHYCVPIRVIADEADIHESGLSEVAVAQMMAALTEEDVPAVYCREDKKIYIFAGHKDSNVGSTLAHENFHALTDAIGDARENRYMLDEYRYLLLADLDHGEDFSRIWKAVADAYPPHKRAEEFVAYTVGLMYVSEGAAKAIRRILDGNAKSSIFQQLINPILYGTQTKTDAYRSANSENRRGGGAGVQQGRAGNSQAEGRADGEESAGGEIADGKAGGAAEVAKQEQKDNEAELNSQPDGGGDVRMSIGGSSEANAAVYQATKEMLESAGVKVHEIGSEEAQAMLEKKNTPVAGLPNRANEKQPSGSVLAAHSGGSSSSATDSRKSDVKVDNNTRSAKIKIKKFKNGDFDGDYSTLYKALSSMGNLLSMRNRGGSRYTILRTDKGDAVAIRLSDHRANGNNFGRDVADRNLSIVIERKRYDVPDSEIEFTEAVIPLRVFEMHPKEVVSAIVNGVDDVLADKPFTLDGSLGAVIGHHGNDVRFHIRTYHGTGAEFDRFDFGYVGSGEGAQAFGWGGYVTEVKGIGKSYASAIGGKELLPKIEKVAGNIRQVRQWLSKNEEYNKYARNAGRHLRELQREYRAAEKGGNEKDRKFYGGLIELQEQSMKPENHASLIANKRRQIDDYQKELKDLEAQLAQKRHLYTVRIPDDTGDNYLDWDGGVTDSVREKIVLQADAEGVSISFYGDEMAAGGYFAKMGENAAGFQLYSALARSLGSDKAASGLLSRAGLTGIKYAADRNNGGRADGKKNYVVFKEDDMRITGHVRFLKGGDGTVYGWVAGGEVYLNRDVMNPETPVHEYTHLWDEMVRRENPELWARGVELMKQTPLWDEVLSDPNYADIRLDEDAIASEVHARLTGSDGAKLMEEMIVRAKKEGVFEIARAVSLVEELKRWLSDMFRSLKKTLDKWSKRDLRNLTVESFNRMTLRDLAEGKNPRSAIISRETAERGLRLHAAMARGREAFDALRDRVVAERGIVMPGLNEKVVRVVEVPRHDFAGNGKEALQAAEKWAKENIVGTHTALDSRGDEFGYTISGDAVEKYVSRSATGKSANIGVHLAALKKLPEIIKESIEAEVHPDYDKLNGIRNAENITNPETLIHRFYGAANVDGTIYRVKTTMREYRDKNRSPLAHSYEITQIELLEAPSDGVINNSGEPLAMTSNSSNVEPTVSPKDSGAPHRIANLLKGVEKSYDPGKKLLEESEKSELFRQGDERGSVADYSKIKKSVSASSQGSVGRDRFGEQRQAELAARERERMAARIRELAERLHLDNVEVVADASQFEGKRATAKGFFNKQTGKITIVLPNNLSTIDAEQTLLHEAVAHYGLRKLLGERFDTFLDNVYESATEEIRRKIAEMAARNGWNFRTATEEYLAGLAENTDFESISRDAASQSWWAKVKQLFIDMVERVGFKGFRDKVGVTLTDNELRYILWRSYANLAEPGATRSIFGEAADIAKQSELKVGNYAEGGIEAEYVEPEYVSAVNERFNEQLERWSSGVMRPEEVVQVGVPTGILSSLMPTVPILLRQKVLSKSRKKHGLSAAEMKNLPEALGRPIFVFKSSPETISVLTELKSADGNNLFVAIELGKDLELGGRAMIVNDILTIHGREIENVVLPILYNDSLVWADKEKGLEWLRSAKSNSQANTSQTLDDAAKKVKEFENPKFEEEELYRPGDAGASEALEMRQMRIRMNLASRQRDNIAMRNAAVRSLSKKIGKIRRAMEAQRVYDFNTVGDLREVAMLLMRNDSFLPEGPGEVSRLLGILSRGIGHRYTGKDGVERVAQSKASYNAAVESLMDLFVSNQLRLSKGFLGEMLKVRGGKVNSRGVEVAGELDAQGQIMVKAMRHYIGSSAETIRTRMGDLDEIIAEGEGAASMNAAAEKLGLEFARQYADEVKFREEQEELMRGQLDDLAKRWNTKMPKAEQDAYRQEKRALEESIRKMRLERAEALRRIAAELGSGMRDSIERVKEFRDREKARVEEIRHNANSDMEGRPHYETDPNRGKMAKLRNSAVARALMAPAATFEQMMRVFGRKSVDGEGYLFDRFVRGWQECRDREWTSTQAVEAELNKKAAELLGRKKARWSSLYDLTLVDAGTIKWKDGGKEVEHALSQGNLMYMYMVDKMADGRVKLRHMGITEEKMRQVESQLTPELKAAADWLQEEFLPKLRDKYNEVHMRMFGAPMADIDNYFPLRILANSRIENVEMDGNIDGMELPKTMTGAIIKRRHNSYALDIMGSDAVSVALDHVREMETWAAFAEYRRDLCTLLSYKRFRNQVRNMTTIYGSGDKLWKKFYNLALLAGGAYQPKVSEFDKAAVNLTKLATGACINFRINTAFKQILSLGAFAPECNAFRLLRNLSPWRMRKSWQWAMKNMPAFQRRWQSRQAGNETLSDWKYDWSWTQSGIVKAAQRVGMTPNAFVDALTVAIGSEAVFRSKYKEYRKDGFSKKWAYRRALQDAEVAFNLSQQSSEAPYLSLLQSDRTFLTTAVTTFRNSSMSYLRQSLQSKREMANMVRDREEQIVYEFKKGLRMGLTSEQAKARAKRKYKRNWARNLFKMATYDFILPALWYLGNSGIYYLIFGDDDDKKKDIITDALIRGAAFGWAEGLTFGGTIPDFAYGLIMGREVQINEESSPATGLLTDFANTLGKGKYEKSANIMINMLGSLGVGVSVQTATDIFVAGIDLFGQDEKTAMDWTLFAMRVFQCPQSQMDMIYFDELGMTAGEAQGQSPAELAERYAAYKARRANFATMWAYDDERWEAVEEPWRKRFEDEAKARLREWNEAEVNEKLDAYEAEYEATNKRRNALGDAPMGLPERAEAISGLNESPEGVRNEMYKKLNSTLKMMVETWLEAPTGQEASADAIAIVEYKRWMAEQLDGWEGAKTDGAPGRNGKPRRIDSEQWRMAKRQAEALRKQWKVKRESRRYSGATESTEGELKLEAQT